MAAAISLGCLLCAGAGFCLGVLWVLRSRRLAERDERHRAWMAERMARASIDLATHCAVTLEQAQGAIAKAMTFGPRRP